MPCYAQLYTKGTITIISKTDGFTQKMTVIVPSLNPDKKLTLVISSLANAGFHSIILVDDGSSLENKHFFTEAVSQYPQCVLLTHAKNLGKGRALKTAFNYFLQNNSLDIGAITVDGDNQHHIDDVLACAKAFEKTPDSLILGSRQFGDDGVPLRSSFGNKFTSFTFKALCGLNISDTQTGLRAIPTDFITHILSLYGERFDYETNMLLETKRLHIKIHEIPIRTIYEDENKGSHFNPLRDSLLIYKLIFKFCASSISSTAIDILLFMLFNFLFSTLLPQYRLLIATVAARICSSIFNYFVNKSIVFSTKASVKSTFAKYYLLCIIQTGISYGAVFLLTSIIPIPDTIVKIIVDTLLFFISFQIQRELIFKEN